MLAQLDDVTGVEESRIDWTGRYFLLKLTADADRGRVEEAVLVALGDGAKRAEASTETERIAAFQRGEPWMRSGETLKLSGHEAQVLGERFTQAAAKEVGLDAAKTERLLEVVRDETRRLLESLHTEGGNVSERFMKGWEPAVKRVHERSLQFLTKDEADRIETSLRACFEE